MRDCETLAETAQPVARPVRAGSVHEVRVRLAWSGGAEPEGPAAPAGLSLAMLRVRFFDRRDEPVDPRLATADNLVPHLDPMPVEVIRRSTAPGGAAGSDLTEKPAAAGTATRYFVAPPDAVRADFAAETAGVAIADLQVAPLGVHWLSDGETFAEAAAEDVEQRCRLIEQVLAGTPEGQASAAMREIPAAQIAAIVSQFGRTGEWARVLERIGTEAEARDFDARVERLASGRTEPLTVGFVGTPRCHDRLRCLCDVFWLREGDFEHQLLALDPDLVLIETAPESGPGDWNHAFNSLDGGLPARGRALIEAARARGLTVHVHVTAAPAAVSGWRGALDLADRVVVEAEAPWPDAARAALPASARFIRRATEPAAVPAALLREREADLMLVPVGSDIFQFPDFAEFLRAGSCYDTLIADFHYGFAPKALSPRLAPGRIASLSELSERQRTFLLQNADVVLLNGRSLRTDAEMLDLVLDAISAGAVPVLVGPTGLGGPVFDALDRVATPTDLLELQRSLRIPWLRERRWGALYRQVMRDHLWRSDERASLLGRDPCAEDFDRPRMSAVMISKRPHLLEKCLATFRGQSWPDSELVLVLNVDTLPGELPPLRENERLFVVPEHFNIGRCLNMGIDAATGRYWAKMDDDDYYSATYLEEYAWYYRATQADTLGRQSVYFYFDGEDCTKARFSSLRRCRRSLESGEFVAGASLSGQRQASLPRFSNRYRNSADFYWMKSLWEKGKRIFSYDSTSIVVFRDASEGNHTWMASGISAMTREFSTLTQGNIFPRIEKDDPVLCRAESRQGPEEEDG